MRCGCGNHSLYGGSCLTSMDISIRLKTGASVTSTRSSHHYFAGNILDSSLAHSGHRRSPALRASRILYRTNSLAASLEQTFSHFQSRSRSARQSYPKETLYGFSPSLKPDKFGTAWRNRSGLSMCSRIKPVATDVFWKSRPPRSALQGTSISPISLIGLPIFVRRIS